MRRQRDLRNPCKVLHPYQGGRIGGFWKKDCRGPESRDGWTAAAAIDFIWGVNLSRALSEAIRTGYSFRTVSIGRVQGPALNFIVEREVETRAFVPFPYWTVSGSFAKDGRFLEARYSSVPVLQERQAAEEVKRSCEERRVGVISRITRESVRERPPPPFNLADLQKEAFRVLGYTPSKTLQVAEKLYLGAVISYPRTGSQRLPRIDYRELLSRLTTIPGYKGLVERLLSLEVPPSRRG